MVRACMLAAILVSLPSAAFAVITEHFTDFIPDNTRTNFNGFEAIAPLAGDIYSGGAYTEDGITVKNPFDAGALNTNVDTTCTGGVGFCFNPSHDGARSWYPNGGDLAYTSITRAGNLNFDNVGFIVGSGFGTTPTTVYYELRENGVLVKSNLLSGYNSTPSYIGFSGGGFNEIRIRDGLGNSPSIYDGTTNVLAIDSIELSSPVPEPSTWSMLASGAALLLVVVRRRLH